MTQGPKTNASVVGANQCGADFCWTRDPGDPMRCWLTVKDAALRTLIRVELGSQETMVLAQAMFHAARDEVMAPDLNEAE